MRGEEGGCDDEEKIGRYIVDPLTRPVRENIGNSKKKTRPIRNK